MVGATLKMVGSLILILGLIICFFYVMKRFRLRPFSPGDAPSMRLVGMLNLAPKRGIALVEVGEQWLIVGVGTESVTFIAEVERPPDTDHADAATETGGQTFRGLLKENSLLQPWKRVTAKRKDATS